jgi:hypothetical protein
MSKNDEQDVIAQMKTLGAKLNAARSFDRMAVDGLGNNVRVWIRSPRWDCAPRILVRQEGGGPTVMPVMDLSAETALELAHALQRAAREVRTMASLVEEVRGHEDLKDVVTALYPVFAEMDKQVGAQE